MSNVPDTDARDTEPSGPPDTDRREAVDRAGVVLILLERCHQELGRLELVPNLTTDEVNSLSMARGFVERAERALESVGTPQRP